MGQFRWDYWRIDTCCEVALHLARANFEEGFRREIRNAALEFKPILVALILLHIRRSKARERIDGMFYWVLFQLCPLGQAIGRMLLVAGGEIMEHSGNTFGGRPNPSTLLSACQCPNSCASSSTPANAEGFLSQCAFPWPCKCNLGELIESYNDHGPVPL